MNKIDRVVRAQRMPETEGRAMIRVVGVGGGGGNAVNRMIDQGITGVDFIAVNTDSQDLLHSSARQRVLIGERTSHGLGSGGNPEVGAKAAAESEEELHQVLRGSDMVFVTATMGGGTGTGASPTVAKVARAEGALTIGVVTRPFSFEGTHKARNAETGIERLKEYVDTLIVIPNDRLLDQAGARTSLLDSFKLADEVLRQGIQGISELITVPGLINLDFADVKAIMGVGGAALMAIGHGKGENRAEIAALNALDNNLVDVRIDGARGILFNVTGGSDLSLHEINQAAAVIRDTAHPDVNLIFGAVIDESLEDEVRVTVIATGFEHGAPAVRHMTRDNRFTAPTPGREATTVASKSQAGSVRPSATPQRAPSTYQLNDLDVPAFLRKKSND